MNTKCPNCRSDIIDKGDFIRCERADRALQDSCNFVIWRDALKGLGKAQLHDRELGLLIGGQEIPLTLMSKKTGKPFDCRAKIKEEDGKWKVKLIFIDSPPKKFGEPDPVPVEAKKGEGEQKYTVYEDDGEGPEY